MSHPLRAPSALVLALGLAAPGAAQEASLPPPRLTLAEAVEKALAHNDRLIDARDNVEQAGNGVRAARSYFRPKLIPNILGSFGQTDISNQTYRLDLSQRLTTGTELRAGVATITQQNQLGSFYDSEANFSLNQPLLRGFGRTVTRRSLTSAEVRLDDTRRQQVLAERQVTVEVVGAYYRLVAQKRAVLDAEKSLERARQLLEASSAKLQAGKVSQLDVFRAQQLVAQAEGSLLDAQAAAEDAHDQLRFLMGRGYDFVFEVVDEIPFVQGSMAREDAVEIALRERPELAAAQAIASEAERSLKAARNQLLPQLDVNLALTGRKTSEDFGTSLKFEDFTFNTFFAISLPGDRTQLATEFHNALIERDRQRRQLQTLRMRITDEARRAARELQRLLRTLEVADQSLGFAEKEAEVANLRFQRGLSNNLDLVNAEAGLLAAQSRRVGVLAELAVARVSLRATLGTLDPRRDVAGSAEAR
jgi:outer membrane protein TolC